MIVCDTGMKVFTGKVVTGDEKAVRIYTFCNDFISKKSLLIVLVCTLRHSAKKKKTLNASYSGVLYRCVVAVFCPCEDACVIVSVRSDKGDFITKLLNVDRGNDGIYNCGCWI